MIFVMEKKHLRRIREKYGDQHYDKKVIYLDISDDYGYMDDELIELLRSRVRSILRLGSRAYELASSDVIYYQ